MTKSHNFYVSETSQIEIITKFRNKSNCNNS